MKLKQLVFCMAWIMAMLQLNAQTGIGTTTPHASAKLDVYATNKGFLPPRVTLTSATDVATISSPAEGLLVYNVGSGGLQAGYYYWNGAYWTTIATASLSGVNVLSANLVKLYQEGYSTAANKAPSADGYSFTVPVSGRYEFNFNSTGWNSNGSKIKLTFNIRQGTTILESDYHESTSSNVWVEYEGRVEVNLNAGITYNAQVVTTTGQRDSRDFDKIFYKQVAGNLPINQHVADRNFQLNSNYLSNDGGNEGIRIDNSGKVGIGTATPTVPLEVNGAVNASTLNLSNGIIGTPSLVLKNGDAAAVFSDIQQIRMGWSGSAAGKSQYAQTIHTRHNSGNTSNAIDFYLSDGTADNTITSGSTRAMTITSPGDVEIAGKLTIGNSSGNVVKKVAGFVNAGDYIVLDNLKVRMAPSGYRSIQVATVSGTYTVFGSDLFSANGAGGTTIFENNKLTITTNPTYLNAGLHFAWGGYTDTWTIMDTDNFIAWRITCIIGNTNGAYANFITIERLL